MRLILAVHRRELKTSMFLAVNSMDNVDIVATANSTGELLSYCRTLRPNLVILEKGLPGRGLTEALAQLDESMAEGRVFVVDGDDADTAAQMYHNVEKFTGIEMLKPVP